MARIGITYEEVELTAEHLLQDGIEPTIERIRHSLGTGSNTTISKYLKEWRIKRLQANPTILPALNTPPDPVNQAVSRVWQQLQEENETKIKEIEAAARQKIDEANAEKIFAIEGKDRLVEDNQDLRNLLKEARQQNAELEKKQIDLNQNYAALEAKFFSLEESYGEFKALSEQSSTEIKNSHQAMVCDLKKQLESLEASKDELISEIKHRAEDSRHQHIAEIDGLRLEKQKLQQQLNEKEKANQSLIEKLSHIEINSKNNTETIALLKDTIEKNTKGLINKWNESLSSIKTDLSENGQIIEAKFEKGFNNLHAEIISKLETKDVVDEPVT